MLLRRHLRLGDAIESGVHLDQGEEARVVPQPLSRRQARGIEMLVVGPVAGPDQDAARGAHVSSLSIRAQESALPAR